eukprot:11196134-Lingulodinium_polyedra.AAC.1
MTGRRAINVGGPRRFNRRRGGTQILEDGCVLFLVYDTVALEHHAVLVLPHAGALFCVLFDADANQVTHTH